MQMRFILSIAFGLLLTLIFIIYTNKLKNWEKYIASGTISTTLLVEENFMLKIFLVVLLMTISSYKVQAASEANTEKPYVIGSILGRLGNYLFQVATTSAVAWDNGAEAYFPDFATINAHTDQFNHIFFRCNIQPPSNKVEFECGRPPYGYEPIPYRPGMKISGYCQNEKYFAHHRDRLIKLFAPHPKDKKYIQKKYGKLLKQANTVSVHLRYYYAEKPDEDSFVQYDKEYFVKAMALFPADSLFIVTSDNLDFARQNIPTNGKKVVFIENEPFYIDFFIQSMCKHNIISNSTFSWWSAWLNRNENKIVVRPKVWLEGYPDIGGPQEWVKIDIEGMQARRKRG